MRLRQYLDAGQQIILRALVQQVSPIRGKAQLIGLARTLCHHEAMAYLLGEIFDIIGEYGALEIRTGNSRGLEREYFEGGYWDGGLFSRLLINRCAEARAVLDNPAILISDLNLEDPDQFVPLLEVAFRSKITALVILAGQVSDRALALFSNQKNQEKLPTILVKVSSVPGDARTSVMEDIAVLCGGRPLFAASGEKLKSLQAEDLGQALQVWATLKDYGIIGGRGNGRALRKHIANLRQRFAAEDSQNVRQKLQERIGKLMGGSATLYVGADSEAEVDARREIARRAAETMRCALHSGVVPGGGIALLNCRAALQKDLGNNIDSDCRAAFRILIRALEVPFRALLTNAGYDPAQCMLDLDGPGIGFDVLKGQVVDTAAAGILDPVEVIRCAVQAAISGAAIALTTTCWSSIAIHRKFWNSELEVNV